MQLVDALTANDMHMRENDVTFKIPKTPISENWHEETQ